MIVHKESLFTLVFGNKNNHFIPTQFHQKEQSLLSSPTFEHLKTVMPIDALMILHQIHSARGIALRDKTILPAPFEQEGDFLTTNLPNIGLAVATADCLPIIFVDPVHPALALVHAGWRGSVAGIVLETLTNMRKNYNSQPPNIAVFFGPSARSCCYKVTPEFINHIPNTYQELVIAHRNNNIYMDLPLLNQLMLIEAGISPIALHNQYNFCTICVPEYCSYRTSQGPHRQITVGCLN